MYISESNKLKWMHRLLTVLLLIILTGYGIHSYISNESPDDILITNKKINEDSWLYITKYNNYGAPVPNIYRYYLGEQLNGDFLSQLSQRKPFLVADMDNAKITNSKDHIDVAFTGNVYSFSNADAVYSGDKSKMPIISLTATSK